MLNSIVIIIIKIFFFFFFYLLLLLLYFIYRKSRVKTIMQIVLFVVGVHTHRVLCSYNKYRNTKTNNNRTDTTTTTTHAAKANNKETLVVGVVVVVVVITNNHNTINNHMTNNARVTVRPFAWRTVRRLLWLAGWLAAQLAKRRKASYVYYCSQEPRPRLA